MLDAPHMAAVYIGSAFSFEKEIRDLFLKPKHTIACKLDNEKKGKVCSGVVLNYQLPLDTVH